MSLSTDAFLLPEGPKLDGFPKDSEMGAYEGLLKTLAQALQELLDPGQAGLDGRALVLKSVDALLEVQHTLLQ